MPDSAGMFELVGQIVLVEWAMTSVESCQEDKWHCYRVVALDINWRAIKLQGVADGSSNFISGPMWVPLEHIACMEAQEEELTTQ